MCFYLSANKIRSGQKTSWAPGLFFNYVLLNFTISVIFWAQSLLRIWSSVSSRTLLSCLHYKQHVEIKLHFFSVCFLLTLTVCVDQHSVVTHCSSSVNRFVSSLLIFVTWKTERSLRASPLRTDGASQHLPFCFSSLIKRLWVIWRQLIKKLASIFYYRSNDLKRLRDILVLNLIHGLTHHDTV